MVAPALKPRPAARPDVVRPAPRRGDWITRAWRARRIRLPRHWPFTALFAGFPLWWALGIGSFAVILFSVAMAVQLRRMGRAVRVPRGIGWWLCFLLAVLVSGLMLGKTAPGTLPDSVGGQIIAYTVRLLNYGAATVLLLYVGNLGERGLPERRILGCLSILFVATVGGGLLGILAPRFQFTSPLELILPAGLRDVTYVRTLVHPAAAQVQDVLGYSAPRPKAPYEYTNVWGNVFGLLVIWFFVWVGRARLRRLVAVPVLAAAAIPVVFSLNRGLWIGLALVLLLVGIRLLLSGRLLAVTGLATAGIVAVVLFTASPLDSVVAGRLANPHSNDIRASLADAAVRGAQASPIVGWGTTREVRGSSQSIAIGARAGCVGRCGNADIGSTGHFWLVLFAQGFLGIALYIGFFLAFLWHHRGTRSPVGIAAQITVLVSMWFIFVYSAAGWPLAINMVALALLWRHREPA